MHRPDVLPTCLRALGRGNRDAPEVSTFTLPWDQRAWGDQLGLAPTCLRQALICVGQTESPERPPARSAAVNTLPCLRPAPCPTAGPCPGS